MLRSVKIKIMYLNHFSKYRLIIIITIKKEHIYILKYKVCFLKFIFKPYIYNNKKKREKKKDACILSIFRNYILNKKKVF